jgi:hypothetical protein
LRKIYGRSFAHRQSDEAKLSEVLAELNEPSLKQHVLTITIPAVSKKKFEKQRLIADRRAFVDAKAVSIIL